MTTGVVAVPRCDACGAPASRVETVPPGAVPAGWDGWDDARRQLFVQHRDPGRWQLLLEGVVAGNGWVGDAIDEERAAVLHEAFREPLTHARVRTAGFHDDTGFCGQCDRAYCATHWHVSGSGYGRCPQGHGKSLDPHWSPD